MKRWLLIAAMLACSVSTAFAQGVPATANLTAQDSGTCTTPNACLTINIPKDYASSLIQLSGTFSATVQFEASTTQNGAFTAIGGILVGTPAASAVTSATGPGAWRFNVSSVYYLRVRVSAYTSGTVTAALTASPASSYSGNLGGAASSGVSSFSGDGAFACNSTSTSAVTLLLCAAPVLPNGSVATTQTAGDSSNQVATDAFVLANQQLFGGIENSGPLPLVLNGNFESSATLPPAGWSPNANATVTYETTSPYEGLQTMKMVSNNVGSGAATFETNTTNALPGDIFYIAGAMKSDGTVTATIGMNFLDKNAGAIGATCGPSTTSTSYVYLSATCTAPAGTVFALISLYSTPAGTVGTTWFDAISAYKENLPGVVSAPNPLTAGWRLNGDGNSVVTPSSALIDISSGITGTDWTFKQRNAWAGTGGAGCPIANFQCNTDGSGFTTTQTGSVNAYLNITGQAGVSTLLPCQNINLTAQQSFAASDVITRGSGISSGCGGFNTVAGFPANNAVFNVGLPTGGTLYFNTRFENLRINSTTAATGDWAFEGGQLQEFSGFDHVDVVGSNSATATHALIQCVNCAHTYWNDIQAGKSGANDIMDFQSQGNAGNWVQRATANNTGNVTGLSGYHFESSSGGYTFNGGEELHAEGIHNAVEGDANTGGIANLIDGSNTCTDVLHLDSGAFVWSAEGISAAGCTNLVDDLSLSPNIVIPVSRYPKGFGLYTNGPVEASAYLARVDAYTGTHTLAYNETWLNITNSPTITVNPALTGQLFAIFNNGTGTPSVAPSTGTISGGGVVGGSSVSVPQGNLFLGLCDGTNCYGGLSGTGASSGANTALSNLASVAVNTALLPATDATINLDSASFRYQNGWFSGNVNAGALATGSSPPTACGTATGCIALGEASTAGTPTTGVDYQRADSAKHAILCSFNGGAEAPCNTPVSLFTNKNLASNVSITANTLTTIDTIGTTMPSTGGPYRVLVTYTYYNNGGVNAECYVTDGTSSWALWEGTTSNNISDCVGSQWSPSTYAAGATANFTVKEYNTGATTVTTVGSLTGSIPSSMQISIFGSN